VSEQENTQVNFWERLGILTAPLNKVRDMIELTFRSGQVPCLVGAAGIGKTEVFNQIGDDNGWKVVFMYLAHREPEDIAGIPVPNKDGRSYRFLTEESIHDIVHSDTPTILVFDEWNRGEKPVMNAAFTVMEARRFGSYTLPDHVYVAAAMNPSEDNYVVNEAEKDPAFRRRLCFVGVRVDTNVWLEWANGRGNVHPIVTGYINVQRDALMDTSSRDAGKIYANPASWEKVSNALKAAEKSAAERGMSVEKLFPVMRIQLAGLIGAGMTEAFLGYYKDHATAISPDEVLHRYETAAKQKVLSLVKSHKHRELTDVCESTASALASGNFEVEDVVGNVSLFAKDLPHDMANAFFVKITKHLNDTTDTDLKSRLSRALSNEPAFREVYLRILNAHENVEEEMHGGEKAG
jgi:hypothetical protein